ncbi:unnamed protein product [Cuscuta europaea]|uniref:Uncharacterized protein n=1 Tax=Cuscuta europaea TaxID=41803 RepID=A0A9P0Z329_CUSEU|nr:unnamed protein product [Cuscuta europaea]
MTKEKGSSILIPIDPKNSSLIDFLAILTNFVGLTNDDFSSISKNLSNFDILKAYVDKPRIISAVEENSGLDVEDFEPPQFLSQNYSSSNLV